MNRVLIIEDEEAYQRILKESFEREFFQVAVASDVKQAYIEATKTRPDAILLDIILPGGANGFDFLEQIKTSDNTKYIPVVIVTNIESEENVAKQIGASHYFVKSETTIGEIIKKTKQLLS